MSAPTIAPTSTARDNNRATVVRSRISPPQPLVPIALAMIAGILLDERLSAPFDAWLCGFALSLLAFVLVWRRSVAALALGLAIAFAGAAWNHQSVRLRRDDDIGFLVGAERQLARVRGSVVGEVVYEPPTDDPLDPLSQPATRCVLETTELRDGDDWTIVSGRLAVTIRGERFGLGHGDAIEAMGWLSAPSPPANEGEWDFADDYRRRRVRATLFCEDVEAVSLRQRAAWSLARWRDDVRANVGAWYRDRLAPREAGLAEAVFLGARARLSRSELEPFIYSGTLHLLVVSGTHLALLVAVAWSGLGLIGVPMRSRAAIVLVGALAYAFLTGSNPPVVRAAVLVTIVMGGLLLDRPSQPLNSLAAAAIVVFALDPQDLFRTGPQLSFLAVLGLTLFAPRLAPGVWLDRSSPENPPTRPRPLRARLGRWAMTVVVASLAAGLLTAPLLAHRFHLASPIGALLTPALAPLLSIALALGLAIPLTHVIVPALTPALAAVVQGCLWSLSEIVGVAEKGGWGYAFTPFPPAWWVAGFYAVLLLPWSWRRFLPGRWYVSAVAVWGVVGVAIALHRHRPAETMECHVLAVGHGASVVLRFPDGSNVLYDCGSLAGPEVAERVVAPWLWAHDIGAIDAVILSHADIDHYNGLPAIARRFRIGAVYIAPPFARTRESAAIAALDRLIDAGVPIRLTWEGDLLRVGAASLGVRHPPATAEDEDDNAGSVVIEARWNRHSALLTGDVAEDGLRALLEQSAPAMDLLLAPHHGSRSSNSPALAEWAEPLVVASSEGYRPVGADHLWNYEWRGASIFRTPTDGAVSVRWTSADLRIAGFRSGRRVVRNYRLDIDQRE